MTAHEGRPLIAIFADESCLGNGREGSNPGAAGGVIEYRNRDTGRVARWDYWVSEPGTTNNRMALRSAIEAFRIISRKGVLFRVVFTTDSQYLVKGMTEWVHGWIARGWRRKEGPVENVELWREAVAVVAPHDVAWRWVRGHAGHPQNEWANHLATQAARLQTSSDGPVTSTFEDWLAAERARGRMKIDPDPFPTVEAFRPARRLPGLVPQAPT